MNGVRLQDPSHCSGLSALWTLAGLEEEKAQPHARAEGRLHQSQRVHSTIPFLSPQFIMFALHRALPFL